MSKRKRAEKYIGKNIKLYNSVCTIEALEIAFDGQSSDWSKSFIDSCNDIKKSLCFKLRRLDSPDGFFYRKVNSRVRYEVV